MQNRNIILCNKNIEYKLRQSNRARCLRITIYPSGEVAATLPCGMSFEKLEDFLRKKADWILRRLKSFKMRKQGLILPNASRRDYMNKKNIAYSLAASKIKRYGELYNLYPKRITIRNQKTRWGSCSRNGNISINYRIVHLPEKLVDYVIVHELCHLREFNHSKKFWELVAKTIPNWRKIRKEIRGL